MAENSETAPQCAFVCSGCSLVVPGGTGGCRAMFDELTVRQWDRPVAYRIRRMMVDTYSVQHPDEFCASAKSLAAHLTGLCAALEHASHPTILRVLLRWLDSGPTLVKPAIPSARGAVTVAEIFGVTGGEALIPAADRWARAAWDAYAPLHALARHWVGEALSQPVGPTRRRP
jgi:uncharacterized protein DUF5946